MSNPVLFVYATLSAWHAVIAQKLLVEEINHYSSVPKSFILKKCDLSVSSWFWMILLDHIYSLNTLWLCWSQEPPPAMDPMLRLQGRSSVLGAVHRQERQGCLLIQVSVGP